MKPGFSSDPVVRMHAGAFKTTPYELAEPLEYTSKVARRVLTIPKGFRSDLLSIPWAFRRLFPKGGYGRRAAIVHDWLCDERPSWSSGRLAADIFNEAMKVDSVPAWRRKLMYWAVKRFGPRWNRR